MSRRGGRGGRKAGPHKGFEAKVPMAEMSSQCLVSREMSTTRPSRQMPRCCFLLCCHEPTRACNAVGSSAELNGVWCNLHIERVVVGEHVPAAADGGDEPGVMAACGGASASRCLWPMEWSRDNEAPRRERASMVISEQAS